VSPYQFAAVGIRLFAIWLAIYVGRIAPSFYAEVEQYDSRVAVAGAAIVAVGTVATIVILWFFPRSIAKTLVPDSRSVANDPGSPDIWFAIGCGLIGIWLIANAIPGFVRTAYEWFYAQRTHMEIDNQGVAVIYYVAYFVVGLWLLLGAAGARKLFWWARRGDER
jgi:hypothetical protein